jgi:uncharacterized membrane protein
MSQTKVGTFLKIPYDFRKPTVARIKKRWWNPEDKRIFTPRVFGWGFSINMYQVFCKLKIFGRS